MEKPVHRVTVSILGERYTIKGPEAPTYVEGLAADLDSRMSEIRDRFPRLGLSRIAVLAALNLNDELRKLRSQHEKTVELLIERLREAEARLAAYEATAAAASAAPPSPEEAGAAGVDGTPHAGRDEVER